MQTNSELIDLQQLWLAVLGDPPSDQQFYVWSLMHTVEVMKVAIVKTAAKNLQQGEAMSLSRKCAFASKIMLNKTDDPQKVAGQLGGTKC